MLDPSHPFRLREVGLQPLGKVLADQWVGVDDFCRRLVRVLPLDQFELFQVGQDAVPLFVDQVDQQRGREVSQLNLQYFGEELIVPSGALPLSFQAVCGRMML